MKRKMRVEHLERRALMAGLHDDLVINHVMSQIGEGEGIGERAQQFDSDPSLKYSPRRHFLQGPNGSLLGSPSSGTPQQIAANFLSTNAAGFGLTQADLAHSVLKNMYTDADSGVTHMYFKQTFNGLEVVNADLAIHIARDGRIVNASSSFVGNLNHPPQNQTPTPGITATAALDKFVKLLDPEQDVGAVTITTAPSSGQVFNINNSEVANGPVRAGLYYVATPTGLSLAWNLNYLTNDNSNWFDVGVSATNGALLHYNNYVDDAAYRVFPIPVSDPSDGPRSLVVDPHDPVASPFGWHDNNGLPGPDFPDTRGNNVFAQEDRNGGGQFGGGRTPVPRPQGGTGLVFDYPLNLVGTQPSTYTNASVVNLFYLNNIAHDVTFNYGFTEPAGNFQGLNYTRTGAAGDAVVALAQSGGNGLVPLNNAFMATPPDGLAPLMVMGEFDFDVTRIYDQVVVPPPHYSPRRDSDLVADVVLHEFFHGVTNRLTGGPNNAAALNNLQSAAMGEGWSDFFALWLLQRATDLKETPIAAGAYLGGQNPANPAQGLRRFPYSFDLGVNPLTLGDYNIGLSGAIPNFEEHAAGEIWASALWDLNWILREQYGFDPDYYSGDGGNNLAFRLVMLALKLQPANPTFTEARDAIFAADSILNQGVNHHAIWQAFARRGFGFSADSDIFNQVTLPAPFANVRVDSSNSVNVQEAFDFPATPAVISGTVFSDLNGNRLRDSNEGPIVGAKVYVDVNKNGRLDNLEPVAIPDANGNYSFTFHSPTRITIGVDLPPNMTVTSPTGQGSHDVVVTPNQNVNNLDFGVGASASVTRGLKWNDLNGDGVRDPNEPGVPGIFVYVDVDNDSRLDLGEPSAVTGADGTYQLTLEQTGTFRVREVVPPGWEQTFPGVNTPHVITLDRGSVNINVSFGNRGILDYGDAPAGYGVTSAVNGAVHGILPGFHLGSRLDAEPDGVPSTSASSDDSGGVDDDDGVIFAGDLAAGTNNSITVNVTSTNFARGKLQGWIDFNRDGDWNDPGEQIFKNVKLNDGSNPNLTFAVPAGATPGLSYARFRFGYEQDLGPHGRAMAGEVEDYQVRILDVRPDANDDQFSVLQSSSNNRLDVLANDVPSSRGPLSIVNVSTGSQGGSITIPANRTELRYTPRLGFFGVETFTYTVSDGFGGNDTAAVSVSVLPAFEDPIAVDDSFDVAEASLNNILNVLDNDLAGRRGPITIVQVTQPNNGLVTLDNRGTNDPSDDVLRYEPNFGFTGSDQFNYVIQNSVGTQDSAQVTVHVQPGSMANDKVQIRLEATDLTGNPIQAITQGEDFLLRVHVKDIRPNDEIDDGVDRRGVFAAYFDMLYNFRLVSPVGNPTFAAPFTNFQSGSSTVPGLIDEFGAFSTNADPLGAEEFLLATQRIRASGFGEAVFKADPSDIFPDHDVLLFEPPAPPVQFDEIKFVGTSVVVVGAGGIPIALDNTFTVPTNSNNNTFNVLGNDIEDDNPPLIITSVSTPSRGGTVTIGAGGGDVRYTPRAGFSGTEQFTYQVRNSVGLTDSATVTVQVGNPNRDVRIRLEATDANGTPITSTPRGSTYQLRAFVQDVRTLPPVDSGVYAAYFDLLFDAGFTSPVADANNPFGVRITFGPQYNQNGLSAQAGIRGLLDEAGAFQTSFNPLGTSEFLLFTLTLSADREGRVNFAADPAEEASHAVLLYEPPQAVALDRTLFGATSLTIGAGGNATAPIAVDNIFSVAANSSSNSLNVIVNDRQNDPAGATIIGVGTPSRGGTASIGAAGSVVYTPRAGFQGLDQFTYTIRNSSGLSSSATVSVVVGNAPRDVNFRLQTTDVNGNPINQVAAGGEFLLRMLVQDVRAAQADPGVFAAYADVLFNSTLASVIAAPANPLGFDVTFSGNYPNGRSGDANTPNLLNEMGSFQTSLNPLGSEELLVYSVRLRANAAGTIRFETDPADIFPAHDTLVFNRPTSSVPLSQIGFGAASIVVTNGAAAEGEFNNPRNRLDVNNNGTVEPRDVLFVVNALNSIGAKQLTASDLSAFLASGETSPNPASGSRYFPDVNNDRHLSAMDALMVINHINALTAAVGEGEGSLDVTNVLDTPVSGLESTGPVISSPLPGSNVGNRPVELLRGSIASSTLSPQARLLLASTSDEDSDEDVLTDDLLADISRAWDE